MQGLITLDFGNSHPHAGLFLKNGSSWELLKVVPWKELPIYLEQVGMNPANSQIVLAEVKARDEELFPLLRQGFLVTRVKDYWRGERFAGMPVQYAKTLGEDRLIEAHYAFKKDKTPTLLIDAGTFVTMDVIDSSGFQGGYILPGLEAYFSTFSSGEQLKDIKLTPNLSPELPNQTTNAMRDGYGAMGAFARDIVKNKNLKKIILTGGTASLWESFFTGLDVTVKIEEHFIHWALQHWMTTQVEPQ